MKTFFALIILFFNFGFINSNYKKKDLVKLEGTWEFVRTPTSGQIYTHLRTYDKDGNYVDILASANGSSLIGRANVELEDYKDAKGPLTYLVKETIKFAVKESRRNQIYNYRLGIVVNNGQTFLLTEGGKSKQTGQDSVEWRETWRKVAEPSMPVNKLY